MSNALFTSVTRGLLAANSAAAPLAPVRIPRHLLAIIAVGSCVCVVLVVRRLIRPGKLSLAGTPGRPNHLSFVHVLVLFAMWLAAMTLASGLPGPQYSLLGQAGAQLILLGSCLLVAAAAFPLGIRRGMGMSMRHWIYDSFRGILVWLAVLPVCVGLLLLTETVLTALLPQQQASQLIQEHYLFKVMPKLSVAWQILPVLIAVILAPLSEEIYFRGLFQSLLRSVTGRPWAAIFITSIFFALVHFQTPSALPPLFALSMVLGYNYERCGRLWPAILIHALFNGLFVLSHMLS